MITWLVLVAILLSCSYVTGTENGASWYEGMPRAEANQSLQIVFMMKKSPLLRRESSVMQAVKEKLQLFRSEVNTTALETVKSCFTENHIEIKRIALGGRHIVTEANVSIWESFFHAEMYAVPLSLPDGRTLTRYRARHYFLPSSIATLVQVVNPITVSGASSIVPSSVPLNSHNQKFRSVSLSRSNSTRSSLPWYRTILNMTHFLPQRPVIHRERLHTPLPAVGSLQLTPVADPILQSFKFGRTASRTAQTDFTDKCYEWRSEDFLQREILYSSKYRFNRSLGLVSGQSGGNHVKDGDTILSKEKGPPPLPPPSLNLISNETKAEILWNTSQWSLPASEGQDRLVISLLQGKTKGFFLDVGARYWHKGSNSFALEYYYDWKGICVEPDKHFFLGHVVNRSCLVICNNPIDDKGNQSVFFHYSINSRAANPGNDYEDKTTINLQRILEAFNAPRHLDYFSLDIEGHEYAALRGLNLSHYSFSLLSVERPSESLHTLLVKHGYYWLTHLRGNFGENVYIHPSIPNFRVVMNTYRPLAKTSWRGGSAVYLLNPPWPPL